MKFTTAAAASALAAVAAASPIAPATKGTNATVIPDGTPFMVTADAPGHIDLDYYYFQAQSRGIVTGAPTQTAACGPDPHNYAEFVLNNGTLNLYTANPPQSIYVDRSGMGRGLIQYTTGVQGLPRNAQRTTFAINDEGHLVYRDVNIDGDLNFIACRPVNGAKYSIWLGNGGNPADFEECIPIKARASISTEPVKCFYTNDQGIA